MNVGVCPKCRRPCGEGVQRTRHHIKPKRFFRGSRETIYLCRDCHNSIEKRIPLERKLPVNFYYLVVNNFLGFQAVRYYE